MQLLWEHEAPSFGNHPLKYVVLLRQRERLVAIHVVVPMFFRRVVVLQQEIDVTHLVVENTHVPSAGHGPASHHIISR